MTNEQLLMELRRSRNALDAVIAELQGTAQPRRSSLDLFKECLETGKRKKIVLDSKKTIKTKTKT